MPDTVQQPSGDGMQAQILMELGKQSTQLAVIDQKVTAQGSQAGDHENRIRVLESAKAKIIGGAAAAGILSGGVATLIYWALQAHH